MKKWDIVLLLSIIVVALIWILVGHIHAREGVYASVSIDGVEEARYDLNENLSVDIEGFEDGSNHLVIQNGMADITKASCPDGLCVHQMQISKAGETIVCLPNRVVIRIVE